MAVCAQRLRELLSEWSPAQSTLCNDLLRVVWQRDFLAFSYSTRSWLRSRKAGFGVYAGAIISRTRRRHAFSPHAVPRADPQSQQGFSSL